MIELITIAVSVTLGAIAAIIVRRRGYSIRATRISMPFLEADLAKFDYEPAVAMFCEVSAAAIPVDLAAVADAQAAAEATPVMLIHTGWNIVCEAFIRRFHAYPDDDKIAAAASAIGGQNVEFVRMYRDIYRTAIQHAADVKTTFAASYLVRAPSMAERVEGRRGSLDPQTLGRLMFAQGIVQGEDKTAS
jgi:hypothetical protein